MDWLYIFSNLGVVLFSIFSGVLITILLYFLGYLLLCLTGLDEYL